MIHAQTSFISEVQTTFPPSKLVVELNQNHRSDHSLSMWANLDLQPSIMHSPNLLIGPHLKYQILTLLGLENVLYNKGLQNPISRRLRL